MTDAARPRPASKRLSTAPQLPQAPTAIDPSVIIGKNAVLTGNHSITIGPGAVLHPHCKIISNGGPIVISEGSIIWERAIVGVEDEEEDPQSVTLRQNVVIESGAVVEAKEVGEGTVVEAMGRIGVGAVVGKYCKLTPFSKLEPNEVLPDYTVLLSTGQRQVDNTLKSTPTIQELRVKGHSQHLEVLRRLVPNNIAKFQ